MRTTPLGILFAQRQAKETISQSARADATTATQPPSVMKPSPHQHGDCLGGQRDGGHLRRSLRIVAIPPAVREYLPTQHEIIALCCQVLGSNLIQLATFARVTYTVYGFLLGKQGGIWLRRDDESGQYCFGYRTWGNSLGRFTDETNLRKIAEWVVTRGY